MNKMTITGIACWLGGLLLIGFQAISAITEEATKWEQLSIEDMIDPTKLLWMDDIDWNLLYRVLDYLLTMPLYILLFAIGTILFVINAFRRA